MPELPFHTLRNAEAFLSSPGRKDVDDDTESSDSDEEVHRQPPSLAVRNSVSLSAAGVASAPECAHDSGGDNHNFLINIYEPPPGAGGRAVDDSRGGALSYSENDESAVCASIETLDGCEPTYSTSQQEYGYGSAELEGAYMAEETRCGGVDARAADRMAVKAGGATAHPEIGDGRSQVHYHSSSLPPRGQPPAASSAAVGAGGVVGTGHPDDFLRGGGALYGHSPSHHVNSYASPANISIPQKVQPVCSVEDLRAATRQFSQFSDPVLIKRVCSKAITQWAAQGVDAENIEILQIMVGLTNQLFKVQLKEAAASQFQHHIEPKQILFRVYGRNVSDIYDPALELEVFKILSAHGTAPRLYADFPGGRIEEWLEGPNLQTQNMGSPPILCAIASIVAKFHSLHLSLPCLKSLGSKYPNPCLWDQLDRWSTSAGRLCQLFQAFSQKKPSEPMDDFLKKTLANCDRVTSNEGRLLGSAIDLGEAEAKSLVRGLDDTLLAEALAEVPLLKGMLLPPDQELKEENESNNSSIALDVTFCHNDIQANNILVTGSQLRLIDFEYANFNYPAFEIANLFCEMTINYSVDDPPFFSHNVQPEAFPNEESLKLFGSVYLSHRLRRPIFPSDKQILDNFVATIRRFVLSSHLLWGLWSIIRAPQAQANSDFDHLMYAKSRFEAYFRWKDWLIQQGLLHTPKE